MKSLALFLLVLVLISGCAGSSATPSTVAPISRQIFPNARVVSWK